jgi:hypothetical protein
MGGRASGGVVRLFCTTTDASLSEVTTDGRAGTLANRVDNQYSFRNAHITILGVSGTNYCRFIREILFISPTGILSDVTPTVDLDTIGVGGISFTSPDYAGLHIFVTGKAATTIKWFATVEVTSPGDQ